jgi:hypothetical protein
MKSARSCIYISNNHIKTHRCKSADEQNTAVLNTPEDECDKDFLKCTNHISKQIVRKIQQDEEIPQVIVHQDDSYDSQSDEEDYFEEEKSPAALQVCQKNWDQFIDLYFQNTSKRCSLRSVYDIYVEKLRNEKEYAQNVALKKKAGSNPMLMTEEDLKKINEVETNVGARKVSRFWNNVEPAKRPVKKKTIAQTELLKSKVKDERVLNTMMSNNTNAGISMHVSHFSSKPQLHVEQTPNVITKKIVPHAPYKRSLLMVDEKVSMC